MASYNGGKYIGEQIGSILSQLGPDDELVISDDGSTDATLIIIEEIRDDRIRLLRSDSKNIVRNFENALSNVKGSIVFLSDQDDIWHPSKVADCLHYLEHYDLVFTNLEVFAEDISNTHLFFIDKSRKTGIIRNIIKNNYIGATMAFRANVLDKALPFPKGIYMHDIWLAMIAECKGKTFFIEKPLIYYRRHDENASETGEKSSNSMARKISMRLLLIYNLFRRCI